MNEETSLPPGNGRYRQGQLDAKLSEICRRLDRMEQGELRCKTDVHADLVKLREEIDAVKMQVAKMAGVASLAGGIVGGVITTLVARAFGG